MHTVVVVTMDGVSIVTLEFVKEVAIATFPLSSTATPCEAVILKTVLRVPEGTVTLSTLPAPRSLTIMVDAV